MASATVDYNATLVVNAVSSQRAKFDSCAEVSGAVRCPLQDVALN